MNALSRRVLPVLLAAPAMAQARFTPLHWDAPDAAPLIARLRAGGMVLFFRHADTIGENCDISFRVGDRAGQRNIAPRGREQSAEIGRRMAGLGIPMAMPVLAGPVYRARDTAEHMVGAANMVVTDSLLADDYAGPRLAWVLDEHRRLFSEAVRGANRILVGHRTPAIMVAGDAVGGRAFPEGGALVIEPRGGRDFRVLGIVEFAPQPGGGFHGC